MLYKCFKVFSLILKWTSNIFLHKKGVILAFERSVIYRLIVFILSSKYTLRYKILHVRIIFLSQFLNLLTCKNIFFLQTLSLALCGGKIDLAINYSWFITIWYFFKEVMLWIFWFNWRNDMLISLKLTCTLPWPQDETS